MEGLENLDPKTLSTMPKGDFATEQDQVESNFEKEQARQIREEVFAFFRSEDGKNILNNKMSDSEKIVFEVDICDLVRERLAKKSGYSAEGNQFFDDNGNDKTAGIMESYPDEVIKKVMDECLISILGETEPEK